MYGFGPRSARPGPPGGLAGRFPAGPILADPNHVNSLCYGYFLYVQENVVGALAASWEGPENGGNEGNTMNHKGLHSLLCDNSGGFV